MQVGPPEAWSDGNHKLGILLVDSHDGRDMLR
jgi:hypothetical protein